MHKVVRWTAAFAVCVPLAEAPAPAQEAAPEPAPRNRVGAVTYADLEGSWDAAWKGRFVLDVRNALDREPPRAWSYSGFNSFFPDYGVPGRYHLSYRQAC